MYHVPNPQQDNVTKLGKVINKNLLNSVWNKGWQLLQNTMHFNFSCSHCLWTFTWQNFRSYYHVLCPEENALFVTKRFCSASKKKIVYKFQSIFILFQKRIYAALSMLMDGHQMSFVQCLSISLLQVHHKMDQQCVPCPCLAKWRLLLASTDDHPESDVSVLNWSVRYPAAVASLCGSIARRLLSFRVPVNGPQ